MKTFLASLLCCLLLSVAGGQTPADVCPKHIVVPVYPLIARQGRLQGTVTVVIDLGPDGKTISASGSGADAILDRASEEMVRDWVFSPPTADSEKKTTFTFVYEMQSTNSGPPSGVIFDFPGRVKLIGYPLPPGEINQ